MRARSYIWRGGFFVVDGRREESSTEILGAKIRGVLEWSGVRGFGTDFSAIKMIVYVIFGLSTGYQQVINRRC